jgi:hypothetical protein
MGIYHVLVYRLDWVEDIGMYKFFFFFFLLESQMTLGVLRIISNRQMSEEKLCASFQVFVPV